MLETVALCIVLMDWETVRLSYLPDAMQDAWVEDLGVDFRDVDLSDSLGVAADGDHGAALEAIHDAETRMFAMSGSETREQAHDCAKRFAFLAED